MEAGHNSLYILKFAHTAVVINLWGCTLALKKICPKRLGVVQSAELLTISTFILPLGRFEKGRCALEQVRGPISIISIIYISVKCKNQIMQCR